MTARTLRALTVATCAIVSASTAHATPFFLRNGDTVVFMGDSITEGGAYTAAVEDYVTTRFPTLSVRFVNSGVGKDKISGGITGPMTERLRRDVAAFKPTVVTMMFGMNDGAFRPFDQNAYDAFASGYESALSTLRSLVPGVRLTLIQSSPYDEVTRAQWVGGGYNAVLTRYGNFVSHLGARNGALTIDLNAPVVSDLTAIRSTNPEAARKLFPDRIHPTPAGGLLLAKALLKAWGATSVVSAVAIDVRTGKIASVSNARIRRLTTGQTLSWEELDAALPMPMPDDPLTKTVVAETNFNESLNEQTLKVTGLLPRRYRLAVDGKEIAVFDASELANGVNLAEYSTPMLAQAADVHALTLAHNSLRMTRWRRVQLLKSVTGAADYARTMASIDRAEAAVVTLQRQVAIPQWHRFELTLL
ncbi:MAG TPA: SGNH/GDSL hydrolase family protein [Paraburkholderia sp.]|nr:SGNH/GDSL hydrolase family protein [Paraburkholderia sp.]